MRSCNIFDFCSCASARCTLGVVLNFCIWTDYTSKLFIRDLLHLNLQCTVFVNYYDAVCYKVEAFQGDSDEEYSFIHMPCPSSLK